MGGSTHKTLPGGRGHPGAVLGLGRQHRAGPAKNPRGSPSPAAVQCRARRRIGSRPSPQEERSYQVTPQHSLLPRPYRFRLIPYRFHDLTGFGSAAPLVQPATGENFCFSSPLHCFLLLPAAPRLQEYDPIPLAPTDKSLKTQAPAKNNPGRGLTAPRSYIRTQESERQPPPKTRGEPGGDAEPAANNRGNPKATLHRP